MTICIRMGRQKIPPRTGELGQARVRGWGGSLTGCGLRLD